MSYSAGAGRDQTALGDSVRNTRDFWENGVDLQVGAKPRSKRRVGLGREVEVKGRATGE